MDPKEGVNWIQLPRVGFHGGRVFFFEDSNKILGSVGGDEFLRLTEQVSACQEQFCCIEFVFIIKIFK
jgi:hypothetical protein